MEVGSSDGAAAANAQPAGSDSEPQPVAAAAAVQPPAVDSQDDQAADSGGAASSGGKATAGGKPKLPRPEGKQPCPRCQSEDTKFCYFNNYNIKQPRYFCRTCQRYWTNGGTLRDVPPGAGRRKSKGSGTATGRSKPGTAESKASAAPAKGKGSGGGGDSAPAGVPNLPLMPIAGGLPPAPMLPPPFLDPLSAFGLTNMPGLNFPPTTQALPLFDPAAAAVAVAAGPLAKLPNGSLASSVGLLSDPLASAFHPVVRTGGAAHINGAGADAAAVAAQPANSNSLEQRQKRARTDSDALGGAIAAITAVAAAAQQQQQQQPPASSQAPLLGVLPPSDGLGLGTAGPLSSDWLSMAGNPQQAAQLQAAGLGPGATYAASLWGLGGFGGPAASWPRLGPGQQQQQQQQEPTYHPAGLVGPDAAGMLAAVAARGHAMPQAIGSEFDQVAQAASRALQAPSVLWPAGGGGGVVGLSWGGAFSNGAWPQAQGGTSAAAAAAGLMPQLAGFSGALSGMAGLGGNPLLGSLGLPPPSAAAAAAAANGPSTNT